MVYSPPSQAVKGCLFDRILLKFAIVTEKIDVKFLVLGNYAQGNYAQGNFAQGNYAQGN